RVADLELDRLSHRVTRTNQEIDLQPREFRLLEYLMKHAGHVFTRTRLLENVWDYHFDPQTNVIDVHISRLRSKIDKGFAQPLLHTVRGAGYMVREGKWCGHAPRRVTHDRARKALPHDRVQVDACLSDHLRDVRSHRARLFRLEHTAADQRADHPDSRRRDRHTPGRVRYRGHSPPDIHA